MLTAAFAFAVKVTFCNWLAPELQELGLTVTPVGIPLTDRFTLPEKPFCPTMPTLTSLPADSIVIVNGLDWLVLGEVEIEKEGGGGGGVT